MNIRTLLLAGAAFAAVGLPLSANAAEGGRGPVDRDGYRAAAASDRGWRDDRFHGDIRSASAMLRRVDYLQREVTQGARERWLNRNEVNRISLDLREVRQDIRRASYRFGNRLPFAMAQRFDQRLDQIDRVLDRAERRDDRRNDRDGRWDGRGDNDRNDGRGDNGRDGGRGDNDRDFDRDGLRR